MERPFAKHKSSACSERRASFQNRWSQPMQWFLLSGFTGNSSFSWPNPKRPHPARQWMVTSCTCAFCSLRFSPPQLRLKRPSSSSCLQDLPLWPPRVGEGNVLEADILGALERVVGSCQVPSAAERPRRQTWALKKGDLS